MCSSPMLLSAEEIDLLLSLNKISLYKFTDPYYFSEDYVNKFKLHQEMSYQKQVEVFKAERKKEIVKGGIYLVLLVVFIQFYFFEAFKNYLKGGTTFQSIRENVEFLPLPHIILCFNPNFKLLTIRHSQYKCKIFFCFHSHICTCKIMIIILSNWLLIKIVYCTCQEL